MRRYGSEGPTASPADTRERSTLLSSSIDAPRAPTTTSFVNRFAPAGAATRSESTAAATRSRKTTVGFTPRDYRDLGPATRACGRDRELAEPGWERLARGRPTRRRYLATASPPGGLMKKKLPVICP